MNENTDKAYLLGLLVGGGIIHGKRMQIALPYKNWGDLKINPTRGGGIAQDIVKRLDPIWNSTYGMSVYYSIASDWKIYSDVISDDLANDLKDTGLPEEGEYRAVADIEKLLSMLDSYEKKKFFLAGLIDTVGSLAPSHRRFSEKFQIVSFEFKDRNFGLVNSIISLLISLSCVPDQILWNHPNQHSSIDRYYKSWKKGFKIRVSLSDYLLKGGFVFETKKLSAEENAELQSKSVTTRDKQLKVNGRTCLHSDESSPWLPADIRGRHFVHYIHLAKFLGVPFPLTSNLDEVVEHFEKYVCPFTLLTKGEKQRIDDIIENEEYLKKTKYREITVDLDGMCSSYPGTQAGLIFGNGDSDGFICALVLQAISYVIAASTGEGIMGKRVLGNYVDNIKKYPDAIRKFGIKVYRPDRGTCLLVANKTHAALVGYINDVFNKSLIKRESEFGFIIKEPVYEICIKL